MSDDLFRMSPNAHWVKNPAYDWQYIQSLRVAATTLIDQEGYDALTRELAQAVVELTDDLNRKEYCVLKALSSRRQESDR